MNTQGLTGTSHSTPPKPRQPELTFALGRETAELAALLAAFQENGVSFALHKVGTIVTIILK